jgi:hypothetical protein
MNATTAALCTKPALGLALYFLTLCANNQALHNVFIDLGRTGEVAVQKVAAPMDEAYNLIAWRVPALDSGVYDKKLDFACGHPESLLSLTLTTSRENESAVESRSFDAICPPRRGEDPSLVYLGQMRLKRGVSKLVIENNRSIALPANGRVQVLLVGTGVSG